MGPRCPGPPDPPLYPPHAGTVAVGLRWGAGPGVELRACTHALLLEAQQLPVPGAPHPEAAHVLHSLYPSFLAGETRPWDAPSSGVSRPHRTGGGCSQFWGVMAPCYPPQHWRQLAGPHSAPCWGLRTGGWIGPLLRRTFDGRPLTSPGPSLFPVSYKVSFSAHPWVLHSSSPVTPGSCTPQSQLQLGTGMTQYIVASLSHPDTRPPFQ